MGKKQLLLFGIVVLISGCVASKTRYIEVQTPTNIYMRGEIVGTAHPGDTLRILTSQLCMNGKGTCLRVVNQRDGKQGMVRESTMAHTNRIYEVEDGEEVKPKTTFIEVKTATKLYWYGAFVTTAQPGDTLKVVRTKICRSGSGTCWKVISLKDGSVGIVKASDMERDNRVYEKEEITPKTTFVAVKTATKLYWRGTFVATAQPGDTLKVIETKICRSGSGTCWKVINLKDGSVGIVKASDMERDNRVYEK